LRRKQPAQGPDEREEFRPDDVALGEIDDSV
jgi:hypothetical protein